MAERPERFERLVRPHARLIAGVIRRVCGRRHQALVPDVEQEVYLALWKRLGAGKEIEHPASYLYRVALTTAIAVVRRQARGAGLPRGAGVGEPRGAASRSSIAGGRARAHDRGGPRAARAGRGAGAARRTSPASATSRSRALYGWSESVARHRVYRTLERLRAEAGGRRRGTMAPERPDDDVAAWRRAYRSTLAAEPRGCPGDEALAALALGELDGDERARVADHVAPCVRCAGDYRLLAELHREASRPAASRWPGLWRRRRPPPRWRSPWASPSSPRRAARPDDDGCAAARPAASRRAPSRRAARPGRRAELAWSAEPGARATASACSTRGRSPCGRAAVVRRDVAATARRGPRAAAARSRLLLGGGRAGPGAGARAWGPSGSS